MLPPYGACVIKATLGWTNYSHLRPKKSASVLISVLCNIKMLFSLKSDHLLDGSIVSGGDKAEFILQCTCPPKISLLAVANGKM